MVKEGGSERGGWITVEFLEDSLHGAGAAAAGHCDIEFVVVFGHCGRVVGVLGSGSWS